VTVVTVMVAMLSVVWWRRGYNGSDGGEVVVATVVKLSCWQWWQ
jgi:hypothetical protein